MKLVGANPEANVTGLDKLPGKSNYFIGNDPKKWRTNVTSYAKVKYQGVYPGIDVVYYGREAGQLEHDFIVAPGADPKAIAFEIETGNSKLGARTLTPSPSPNGRWWPGGLATRIDANGDLVIPTDAGDVRFHKPVVYQEQPSAASRQLSVDQNPESRTPNPGWSNLQSSIDNRQFIEGHFVLTASNQVRFELSPYDKTRPLVIDPYVEYVGYLGGSLEDLGGGIAVDASGNAYVTGYTYSTDFPLSSPLQGSLAGYSDAFVTKVNPDGSAILYSTYLGGSLSAGVDYGPWDQGKKIAVDSACNAYIVGQTYSIDFPLVNALQSTFGGGIADAFLAKLDSAGDTLVFSTYLGGNKTDYPNDITLDASGDIYLSGETCSLNFPTTLGAFDTTCGTEVPCDCASSNYSPGKDAFVTKVTSSGSALVYSTFLGGERSDAAWDIVVDSGGYAHVVGISYSAAFPTTVGAYQTTHLGAATGKPTAFFAKLNADGSGLNYSTYLGGSVYTYGYGLSLDAAGDAYVTGQTAATDFPTTPSAYKVSLPGTYAAFVTKFDMPGGGLAYSTYLGGQWAFGRSVTPNESGEAWVSGYAEDGFPVTADAFQPDCAGGPTGHAYDGFLAKLNGNGSDLLYSTYFGGSGAEVLAKQATLPGSVCGSGPELCGIFIVGRTDPSDFLVTAGNFNRLLGNDGTYNGGGYDAYIMKVNPGLAPKVGVSQISVTYPEQPAGTTSAPTPMTVGNFTSAPLDVTSIQTDNPDFAVDTKGCIKVFAVGEKCVVDVYFTPQTPAQGAAALSKFRGESRPSTLRRHPGTSPQLPSPRGTRTGTLALSSSTNELTNVSDIPLTGTVVFTALVPSPTGLSFGVHAVESVSASRKVTVTNTSGTQAASLGSISLGGAGSADFVVQGTDCGSSLAALAQCTIDVQFAPTASGPRSALLSLPDLDYGGSAYVVITGVGAAVSIAPQNVLFSDQPVGAPSGPQPVMITNLGTNPVHIWQVAITGTNAGDFGRVTSCPVPPATLAIGANCTINVNFTPATTGARSALLQISHDGGGSPSSVPLSGNGLAPLGPTAFVPVGRLATGDPPDGAKKKTKSNSTPRRRYR